MDVSPIDAILLDRRVKGMPAAAPRLRLGDIGAQGWNVLREEMSLPIAVLKAADIAHNSAWMRDFLARSHAVIAPHGKTTMAPQLFAKQLEDGAWAITLATLHQMQVARHFGVRRIILANQIVGRQMIDFVFDALAADPDFDFYAIVDSEANVAMLAEAARARAIGRPLQLLLEGGIPGGRTGVRDVETGLAVARAVKAAEPFLALRGVEGFEGLAGGSRAENEAMVRDFLDLLVNLAKAAEGEGLFAPGEVILSAGGSAFYDMVLARFLHAGLASPTRVVTRSGCYLTHDSGGYRRFFADIVDRTPEAAEGGGLRAALEVWAYVQSRPEPGKVLLTMGKRDISADAPPVALHWFRPGTEAPQAMPSGHVVTHMNDQHCHMTVPPDSSLAVGDMVGFGMNHPCLTFDKWQVLYVVDDAYTVTSAIRTFF